jgi:GPI-anchor transamidase subunit T
MHSLIPLLLFALSTLVAAYSDYHEQLTLTPLPQGSLLASFDFLSNETLSDYNAQNFRFFPRSLGQALRHASTQELHLRFTTGRWDAQEWGARPWDGTREGGTGVELWAWIDAEDEDAAFKKWTTLAQYLSGLFCASLNFIDATRTTKPVLSFEPQGTYHHASQNLHLMHGALPGEVVCTENLTPFLKLLPCKGKAGISSLLDGHKVFDASWQSMSIDVRPKCPQETECQMEVSQTIDIVLDIERSKRPRDNPIPRPIPQEELICDESKPYHSHDTCYPLITTDETAWSLSDVFGRKMAGTCPLADDQDSSTDAKPICLMVPHERQVSITHSGFEVKSPPGPGEHRCYALMPYEDFDLEVPAQPATKHHDLGNELIRAERTMTGHGAAHGGMRSIFTNPSPNEAVTFVYFETLPWFMRPYIHTLKAEITHTNDPDTKNTRKAKEKLITDMFYSPAIDRQRSTHLELQITIPPATTISLTYSFEKSILRYTEYPPDANRGFNIPAAVIRILSPSLYDADTGMKRSVYIRTTSLLLSLPTPDFSMPYNVIILTSTVIALGFGSIYNLLVRRFVGVDEVPPSKLGGLIGKVKGLVAGWIVTIKDRVGEKSDKVE